MSDGGEGWRRRGERRRGWLKEGEDVRERGWEADDLYVRIEKTKKKTQQRLRAAASEKVGERED